MQILWWEDWTRLKGSSVIRVCFMTPGDLSSVKWGDVVQNTFSLSCAKILSRLQKCSYPGVSGANHTHCTTGEDICVSKWELGLESWSNLTQFTHQWTWTWKLNCVLGSETPKPVLPLHPGLQALTPQWEGHVRYELAHTCVHVSY